MFWPNGIQYFLFTLGQKFFVIGFLPFPICPVQSGHINAGTRPQYLNLLQVGQEAGKQFSSSYLVWSSRIRGRPDLEAEGPHSRLKLSI